MVVGSKKQRKRKAKRVAAKRARKNYQEGWLPVRNIARQKERGKAKRVERKMRKMITLAHVVQEKNLPNTAKVIMESMFKPKPKTE